MQIVWWEKPTLFGFEVCDPASLFAALDTRRKGEVSKRELLSGLRQLDIKASEDDIVEFVATLDANQNGRISKTELERGLSRDWLAPSPGCGRLHRGHAERRQRQADSREQLRRELSQGVVGRGRFASQEEMAKSCDRLYSRTLKARAESLEQLRHERAREIAKMTPFSPELLQPSTARSLADGEPSPKANPALPLKVKVLSGRGLAVQSREVRSARRVPGNLRPGLYCTCEVPGKPQLQFRTLVVDNLRHEPTWNCTEELLGFSRGDSLVFTVYENCDKPKDDSIMGCVTLDSSVLESGGFHGHLRLSCSDSRAFPIASLQLWVAPSQPNPKMLVHQVSWAHKQVRVKLRHDTWREEERRRCLKEEMQELEAKSVHRSSSADAAAIDKRFSRLHRECQLRRERLAMRRLAQEREERKELMDSWIHRDQETSPGKVGEVIERLAERDLRMRKLRAEDRERQRQSERRAELEAAQLSLVEQEARKRRQWTEKDLQQMAERMHRGQGRKLCWQPRFPAASRPELVGALFRALDTGQQRRLGVWQMARLADACGFAGSCDAWESEYRALGVQHRWNHQLGLDERQLAQLLDDRSGSLYCSDEALQFVLLELGTRTELASALFRALSGGRSEPLGSRGLRRFAELCGFDGSEEEWAGEYEALCSDYGWSERAGPDARQFVRFANDREGTAYRRDDELRSMLRALCHRPELTSALFHLLEDPSTRRLGPVELRDFAALCGFDGSEEEWQEEYSLLCAEHGWNPQVGADILHFVHLVNDENSTAYCTDEQLQDLVRTVELHQADGLSAHCRSQRGPQPPARQPPLGEAATRRQRVGRRA